MESNARDYNPNKCDYCLKKIANSNTVRCYERCCHRQCKKHPIYQNPKRCFHKCKKDNYPPTYKNIDEAKETAGASTTTNPIPQRSHGMFQYIRIHSIFFIKFYFCLQFIYKLDNHSFFSLLKVPMRKMTI